ncbi:MAG: DEAD/DEAH box helicase family protein [Candidatus Eremiobacteraeota bacterium]|nr:DEAD/DEAH box helicase family protein [Candidatus Eremiobacteraeota bacterium]
MARGPSQFAFLAGEFPEVLTHAAMAERVARLDPRSACFYARLALEVAVNWMFAKDRSLNAPYETTLAACIHEPTFRKVVGQGRFVSANIIRDFGNAAVHETKPVPPDRAMASVRELFNFTYWLAWTYARSQPDPSLAFSPEYLPQTRQIASSTLAQLQDVAKSFADALEARDAEKRARLASEDARAKLEAELVAAHAEIAAIKAANAATPDLHDYDEETTRDTFIDILLHEAGWPLDQKQDREFPVTGMPNASGTGSVDYVLWGADGKPLGLVEAKRTRKDARVGQQQAKLYADCLEAQFGQRPVILYTNGYQHWMWDDLRSPPRAGEGFYTRDELQLVIQRRQSRRSPSALDVDNKIVERYYQHRAIRKVVESFDRDGLRKALLVMATGSGKTRTAVALCDLLMRANWIKRVLFLADRRALVKQAVNAFKQHLPSATTVDLLTEKNENGRIYVSTYATMMSLIDRTVDGRRAFGVGHFDVIVIDEAHRSVYRKYGAIFSYFDSYLIGLTATPKDEVDRDTYRLFDLQSGLPTDAYSLEEAVSDGFLVPANAVSVPLKFVRDGMTYDEMSDEEKIEWDEIDWGEGGPPQAVDAGALNSWLFNIDTVDKALEYLMTNGLKVASGDRLGKTIVFAKNLQHAKFIVERFDKNYPDLKGSFARVVDTTNSYVDSLIDDFSHPDKPPHIAVSIDMLDTGIDVPEIVNLVFFKVIRSKTKFWQMLGRGTRLRPDLFGPGFPKQFFYVFDFCMNFEFFNQKPKVATASIAASLAQRLFTARVELIDSIRNGQPVDAALETLSANTAARLRSEIAGMTLDNFLVRPKRQFVEKYAQQEAWQTWDLTTRSDLVTEIAGLPTTLSDDDVDAKEFDLLMLRTQLAVLRSESRFPELQRKIRDLGRALEAIENIPMVQAELELILEIGSDEYWQDVTAPMLETVRRRLRSLIKLIDPKKRTAVITDFADEIGVGSPVAMIGSHVGTDIERFRAKARQFFRAHADHVAIAKVRRNEPLTPSDLTELERMFNLEGLGGAEELGRVTAEGGFGLLVRSLVGLDREAAKAAFGDFLAGQTLTANQLEFINVLIEHLTARGVVDPGLLFASPFTDVDPMGVSGVFSDADASRIVDILETVRKNAAA